MEKVPAVADYIVCAPLKIDFICNVEDAVTSVGANLCDTSDVIDADFGDEYSHLKEKEMKFMSEYSNFSFDYRVTDPKDMEAVRILNETSRELSQKLNEKVKLMDYAFRFLDKLMIFIYLKIIYGKTLEF